MNPQNNPQLPRDVQGIQIPLPPDTTPLKVTYDSTISASTEITLQSGTKMVGVTALSQPICMRWGTSDASVATDGYSEIIPAGGTIHRIVPNGTTAINFIEQASGAILSLTEY